MAVMALVGGQVRSAVPPCGTSAAQARVLPAGTQAVEPGREAAVLQLPLHCGEKRPGALPKVPAGHCVALRELSGQKAPGGHCTGAPLAQ